MHRPTIPAWLATAPERSRFTHRVIACGGNIRRDLGHPGRYSRKIPLTP